MLNKDFAGTTASIAKSFTNPAQIVKQDNWGELLGQAVQNYQTAKYKNDASEALADAIANGDEAAQTAAAARLDPRGTYNYLQQIKNKRAEADLAFERQKELANLNNKNAIALKILENNLKGQADSSVTQRNQHLAQMGINQLAQVANDGRIGGMTRFRNEFNLASDAQRQDLGKISSSIAAIAPIAIQRLKESGVSGINTLGEFMTYVGLPENPNSEQIKGALPSIAQIVGAKLPTSDSKQQLKQPKRLQSLSDDELLAGL